MSTVWGRYQLCQVLHFSSFLPTRRGSENWIFLAGIRVHTDYIVDPSPTIPQSYHMKLLRYAKATMAHPWLHYLGLGSTGSSTDPRENHATFQHDACVRRLLRLRSTQGADSQLCLRGRRIVTGPSELRVQQGRNSLETASMCQRTWVGKEEKHSLPCFYFGSQLLRFVWVWIIARITSCSQSSVVS